jgi:hypothetical protein
MSSDRIENPAIADMDRHLDQLAKDDQLVQDIEARARKMMTQPRDLASLLELRDEPKVIEPLTRLIVTVFQHCDAMTRTVELGRKTSDSGPEYVAALLTITNLSIIMDKQSHDLYEALLEDALRKRDSRLGKSLAEELLEADRWDDGSPA